MFKILAVKRLISRILEKKFLLFVALKHRLLKIIFEFINLMVLISRHCWRHAILVKIKETNWERMKLSILQQILIRFFRLD